MEERKTKQQDQMESLVRHFYEIPGKVVMLHDGEYLFHEGDMARYFYIVRSGQIFITKYAMSGRVLSLRLASRQHHRRAAALREGAGLHLQRRGAERRGGLRD